MSLAIRKFFLKIADKLRTRYDPSPLRRDEVTRFLAQRPRLTHEEWHRRFAAAGGIPLEFVRWFRDSASEHFGYDLSGALPDDRLIEDLGMYDATWGDVDWDIFEDYEQRYGVRRPEVQRGRITTFGQFLEALWSEVQKRNNAS